VAEERPLAAAMLSPLGGRDPGSWLCGGYDGGRLAGVAGHDRGASHRLCGVYALSPEEFMQMLENNGVRVDRIVGKLFTMPLGFSWERLTSEEFTEELFDKIMRVELELANRPDTVCLSSHFQAIGYKSGS
jgi:hypothetical protein